MYNTIHKKRKYQGSRYIYSLIGIFSINFKPESNKHFAEKLKVSLLQALDNPLG